MPPLRPTTCFPTSNFRVASLWGSHHQDSILNDLISMSGTAVSIPTDFLYKARAKNGVARKIIGWKN